MPAHPPCAAAERQASRRDNRSRLHPRGGWRGACGSSSTTSRSRAASRQGRPTAIPAPRISAQPCIRPGAETMTRPWHARRCTLSSATRRAKRPSCRARAIRERASDVLPAPAGPRSRMAPSPITRRGCVARCLADVLRIAFRAEFRERRSHRRHVRPPLLPAGSRRSARRAPVGCRRRRLGPDGSAR